MALVIANRRWGAINREGKLIVPPQYDFMRDYSEGMSTVLKVYDECDDRWGYLNSEGSPAIWFQFRKAYSFYEGVAAVRDPRDQPHGVHQQIRGLCDRAAI